MIVEGWIEDMIRFQIKREDTKTYKGLIARAKTSTVAIPLQVVIPEEGVAASDLQTLLKHSQEMFDLLERSSKVLESIKVVGEVREMTDLRRDTKDLIFKILTGV